MRSCIPPITALRGRFGSRRLVALAAMVAAVVLFLPSKGHCVKIDPYLRRSLTLVADFAYTNAISGDMDKDTMDSVSSFSQYYGLALKGNLLHRRFMTYDLSGSFTFLTKEDQPSTASQGYYLSTQILPYSRFPLRLDFGLNKSDDYSMYTYGLTLGMRSKTLPDLQYSMSTTVYEGEGDEAASENSVYRLDGNKSTARTKTAGSYWLSTSKNAGEEETWDGTLHFTNTYNISKWTNMYAGLTHGMESGDASSLGLSMSLSSAPGQGVGHSHAYSQYYSDTDDSDTFGENYVGSLYKKLTSRLSSSVAVSASRTETESSTSDYSSTSMSTSASVSYSASQNLSVSESVGYSESRTTADSSESEYVSASATTSVSYTKTLSWAGLSTIYGIGFVGQEYNGVSGEGIQNSLSVALSDIKATKLASLNASAGYSRVEDETIWSSTSNFDVQASNKLWSDKFSLSAAYNSSLSESWIPDNNSETQSLSLNFGTSLPYNTGLSLSTYAAAFDTNSGSSSSAQTHSMTLTHWRRIFKGGLNVNLSYNYSAFESESEDPASSATLTTFATFERPITRKLVWNAFFDRSVTYADNEVQSISTRLTNSISFQLRRWLFSSQHQFSLYESGNSDTYESGFYLRATRYFGMYI